MSAPFKYTNKLQGRRVLVVGGSSGVGFAAAEAAVESGSIVTISSSNKDKLDKALSRLQEHAKAIGTSPDDITATTIDLAQAEGIDDRIVEMLKFASKTGTIDHVIFTAGDSLNPMPLKDTTVDSFHKAIMVRTVSATILAKHLPDYMTRSNQSSFTMSGGTISSRPLPGWSVVAGFGGTVDALARGFAIDLKPIRVNSVILGAVMTELFADAVNAGRTDMLDMFAKDSITGTIGKPHEAAEAYLYAMRSAFANASQIVVDGGRLVGRSEEVSEFN